MKLPPRLGPIHFIGIGGIGMSGIAEVMHNLGYTVQGSDASDNYNVKRLAEKGIRTFIGHEAENVDGAELWRQFHEGFSSGVQALASRRT